MRSLMKRLLLFTAVVLIPLLAHPCDCLPQSIETSFKQSDKVFLGKVISVSKPTNFDSKNKSPYYNLVRMFIVKSWKGVLPSTEITINIENNNCSPVPKKNHSILVFYTNQSPYVSQCSNSEVFTNSKQNNEKIKILDQIVNKE